jgi:phage FluMu gp28-like protein
MAPSDADGNPIIRFLPYQRRWIEDKARFKIGMMTRRGGKTFATNGEAADDCIQAEIEGRRARWTILSRSEATAKEAMDDALKPMIKAFYAVLKGLQRRPQPVFEEGEFRVAAHEREISAGGLTQVIHVPEATYKTQEVRFPGGSRVVALSASPDAARGFGGNLILDEFAFHADSRRIWGSAYPVAARGGHKIRVISTPNGKGNKFYELMTDESGVWSKHVVDIHQAVREGLDVNVAELRAGLQDEDAWAQEFELAWLDAASAWLDYDLIAACEHPLAGRPGAYQGGPCYLGEDIAARKDLYVAVVVEEVGDVLWVREIVARRRITFAEQDQVRAEMHRKYRIIRNRIDQTGMGEKVVEDARARHGTYAVEGVIFSAPAKLDLATALKQAMEDRKLRLPAGDVVLRSDLHAIRKVVGATGIPRLVADGDTDGHADRFWALALAVSAAASGYQPYEYRAVPPPTGREAGRLSMRPQDDDAPVREDFALTDDFGMKGGLW